MLIKVYINCQLSVTVSDYSKKRAIFLSSCGTAMYKLFKGLTSLARQGERSLEELRCLITQYKKSQPNLIAE